MAGLWNRLFGILGGSQTGRTTSATKSRAKRKLRMELLEGRQMMAVNITGTVFQDLTDNGFNSGVDPNLSGVSVALFRDGGNNTYDSLVGTTALPDDTLVQAVDSAATTGLYSFTVDTAGTYFIVQRTVATGLIQRPAQRVQTVIVTPADLNGVDLLNIDSFDLTEQTIIAEFGAVPPNPNANPNSSALDAPEAIGLERDMFVASTVGEVSMQADRLGTTNFLAFAVDPGSNGTRILTYDGNDNDATTLTTNLLNVDLTSGGTATGFRFRIGGEAGTILTIQVNTGANTSTHTVPIPTTSGASPTATLDIPFSDFLTGTPTGANFATVNAIQFTVSGPDAADAIIDNIGTFGASTITRNIANLTPMSIGNLVFSDRNNNGLFDTTAPTEVGVTGVNLQLFTNTNGGSTFDPGIDIPTLNSSNVPISATTDSSGNYLFSNLFPGSYFVVIPSSQFLTGAPAAGFTVSSTVPTATNNANTATALTGTGVVTSLVTLVSGAAPTTDGDTNNNSDLSRDVGLVPQFDLTVAKTTTATVAATGTTITYTIAARNDGPSPASGVTLSDDIPDGLRVITATSNVGTDVINVPVSAGDTTAANPDNITVDVGSLVASSTTQRTITIVAEVLPITTGTGTPAAIVNSVTIAGLGTELTTLPNISTVSLPVQLRNDITVVKTVTTNPASTGIPAIAAPGSTLTYTLIARNDNPTTGPGSSRATTVRVTDNIPDGIQILTATLGSTALTVPATALDNLSANPDDLVVNIPDLLVGVPNQQTITITAVVLATTSGIFTNTATIASTSTTENSDTNPNNNTSAVDANARRDIDLVVAKTIITNPASTSTPATAPAGSTFTYTILARNDGPSAATTVRVIDNIPDGIRITSVTSSDITDIITIPPTAGDTVALNSDNITIDVGNLGVGIPNQTTITIIGIVLPGTLGSLINEATIAATDIAVNNELDTSDNNSTVTANATRSLDLTVTKNGPTTAVSGNTITYTMTATNNGPSDALGVQVVDNIPDGIRVISATLNGNAVSLPPSATDTTFANPDDITFLVGNLASTVSNSTLIIVAAILPASTAALVNSAVISTTDTSTTENTTNNTASVTTTLTQQNDVSVSKTGPLTAAAGSTITYTMNVTNTGPSVATSVSVVDTLPAGLTFVSGTSTIGSNAAGTVASGANNTANVTIPTLAPAETALVTIIARSISTVTGNITNSVTVTAANDIGPNNNTATAATGLTAPVLSSLSGRIYVDSNNDGTGQSTERGVPGVTVRLTGNTTNGNTAVNQTRTTDANGEYSFTNLEQGTYAVASGSATDLTFRAANPGTPGGGIAGTQQITAINLAGTNSTANNVGFTRVFSKRQFLASSVN